MEDGRNEGRTERVHDLEEENGEQEGFAERNKGESIKGGREGGELKERTFWPGGRKERERLPSGVLFWLWNCWRLRKINARHM